jgi:threonine/homoserine efflux transporter RhtA
MSVNPIFATTTGAVVLGEGLGFLEWSGNTVIVTAKACALAFPDALPNLPLMRIQSGHRLIQESTPAE